MTKTVDKVPPEVAAVLAGRNPFVTARPSEVFRDVFDFGEQALHRKHDEDLSKTEKAGSTQQEFLPKHLAMSMIKHTRKPPAPQHGSWKWDRKLGFLFVPSKQEYAEAMNVTKDIAQKQDALKLSGKINYKENRHPADKIIEGFAKLIKDKEPEVDVVVDASRQVEIEDVKLLVGAAVYLMKYTLHNKLPENVVTYYDSFNCVRGVRSFIKHKDYDEFLLALVHYFYFYLLGLTRKYFRLTLRAGKVIRLPAQIERPKVVARERQRRVFRYEIHKARLVLAKKYSEILERVLLINQPEVGTLRYKPHSIIPERFFFENLLDLSCIAVCAVFLQRSNRFIRAEFGRLFRREAFNMDSLERTMDFTYYETYSERALRALQDSKQQARQREKEQEEPRLSPRSYRLRLSDELVRPTITNWQVRVASRPPLWKIKAKKPFYILQSSVPEKHDYATNKHQVLKEMRQNSPILDFQMNQKYLKLRTRLLHTAQGGLDGPSLLSQLRQNHEPIRHIQYRQLTPFHTTLGILGKQLKLFDYWTLLPMMNDERKLTLPVLARAARYRAFKTTRLLFPKRTFRPQVKKLSSRQEVLSLRTKEILQGRLRIARTRNLKVIR